MIRDNIKQHIEKIKQLNATTKKEIEDLRIEYLGKKGVLNDLFSEFKGVPNEDKKEVGSLLNELKTNIQSKIEELKQKIEDKEDKIQDTDDLTKPANLCSLGSIHPLTTVRKEIIDIFSKIGYNVVEGPEIEDDWDVFYALNFTHEHTAHNIQYTFFLQNHTYNNNILHRTHTSSFQLLTI